jgi:hypothetical protein
MSLKRRGSSSQIWSCFPVIDKSQREDGTFLREHFIYDEVRDIYTCPAGKTLTTTGHISTDHAIRYLASVPECRACPLNVNRRPILTPLSDGFWR